MRLTSLKYNKEKKTKYVTNANEDELVERLGALEDILTRNNINDDVELERLIILGHAGFSRIKLAMGHRVYVVVGNKIKKAHLKGYANSDDNLTDLIIERKEQTAIVPYNRLFISRREAHRARKARQKYKLNPEQYALIFGSKPFKKNTFLLESVRGTDTFVIVQKAFKAYFKTSYPGTFTEDELKSNFNLDIDVCFKEERAKYKEKAKYLKSKWIY
ncbi:MAG: hypothetical protein K6G28_07125 [Acholeplasmatales bacterium]|nr:hypothetical protein [Acholeplasmatales bacterium]